MRSWWLILIVLFLCAFRVFLFCYPQWIYCKNKSFHVRTFVQGSHINGKLDTYRQQLGEIVDRNFHGYNKILLSGLILGKNEVKKDDEFYTALKNSGLVHVVVVSGFNISLFFVFMSKFSGSRYDFSPVITTFFYAMLTGFEPPVARSWLMSSFVHSAKFFGRSVSSLIALIYTLAFFVIINPVYIFNLSFQLSFMATAGLILYTDFFENLLLKRFSFLGSITKDLAVSLAAQVLVWPLISYYFGELNLLAPLFNALILWIVPYATIFGMVFFASNILMPFVGVINTVIVSMLNMMLSMFVTFVFLFSNFHTFGMKNITVSYSFLVIYYIAAFCIGYSMNYFCIGKTWEHRPGVEV